MSAPPEELQGLVLAVRLDPASPLPLYHQLIQHLR